MTDEAEIEVALGAVFDELIELIGEAKQAACAVAISCSGFQPGPPSNRGL